MKSFIKLLDKIEEYFCIAALFIMCIVLIMQIFFRFVLNSPLIWSEELSRFLFIWITFIGIGYGVKHHLHIELTYFFGKMPKKMQLWGQVFINLVCASTMLYILPVALKFTTMQHTIDSTTLPIPMSFLYVALPIGFTLGIIRFLIDTAIIIKTGEVG